MKIKAYTDGACSGNPGPGGWAAILLFDAGKQDISGNELYTTNNRMELKAVVETMNVLNDLNCKHIEIYSDSAYVVNAINKCWITKWANNGWKTTSFDDVKNKDLWKRLLHLLLTGPHESVKFIKVKGHSGNEHNELVDVLAKKEVERAKMVIDNPNLSECPEIKSNKKAYINHRPIKNYFRGHPINNLK